MAKKESKAGLLPKKLEGVKIPKAVREGLIKLAKNPVVADLLAAGLVALAAKLRDDPKDKPAPKAKGNPGESADPVLDATTEIAGVLATKAVAGVRKATGNKAPAKPRAPKAADAPKKPAARKAPAKPAAASSTATTAKRPPAKPPARRAARKTPPKAPAKPKT
jgi:hypothetical protein